ncbi:MAG TPA: GAF domain-containing protein, partial [Thermoanaerobaculia bacterium]|nr:GAF domain-containing protein [Thermoanaerobaculia bacterium]
MPSSVELAARLSGVVSVQQDILAVINDPERVMQVVTARTPDLIGASGAVIQMAGRIELDDLASACVRERRTMRSDDVESDPRADADAGIRSLIITPLVHGSAAIGVLKAYSAKRNAFD